MSQLRFDGRVAVVTGAGRGIGRAHAELLAQRGAQVVVNDVGGGKFGEDPDESVARAAVDRIVGDGGLAVADGSDVSTEVGAQSLVARALEAFGRVDIVVNNAGIYRPDAFPDICLEELERYLAVHVAGSFNVTKSAWPHLARSGSGRVVMTTSHGMLGSAALTSYGAAKGAVFGLANALAMAGRELGIKVNSVAPVAATRLTGVEDGSSANASGQFGLADDSPNLVAPLVALLCHESCPVSGETFLSGSRRFARLYIGETEGYVHPERVVSAEVVADHWDEIMDATRAYIPNDTLSWLAENTRRINAVPVA